MEGKSVIVDRHELSTVLLKKMWRLYVECNYSLQNKTFLKVRVHHFVIQNYGVNYVSIVKVNREFEPQTEVLIFCFC